MSGPQISAPIKAILAAYWRSDRAALCLVAGIVLASSFAAVAAPYVFSRLVDRMESGAAEALALGFLVYAALAGAAAALQRVVAYLSFMSAENLRFIASTSFFARLIRKSPDFFVEHNPAQIQDAGDKGQSGLSTIVQLALIVFIPGLFQITLAVLTLGATVDLGSAAIVLAYGVVFVALSWFANRRTRGYLEAAAKGDQESARLVGNAMQAMETLRHFGAEVWAGRRFEEAAAGIRDNWRAFSLRHVGFGALFGLALCAQVAIAFLLLLLLPSWRAGALSIGDLVLFNALLLQLNRPFEMIGQAIDDAARARAELGPMAEMWAAPAETDALDAAALVLTEGRIAFEAVSYVHGNGRGVRGASFVAERGRITFVVGETGAGKTTVLRLALKSIAPQAGRILVDGVDLVAVRRAEWSARAAVVPQDVLLLNESLAENILLGRPRDEARLRRAAARAAILGLIESLPEGFAATVGERGLKLSGGERQRVAIARALYGAPAILFLDEASSALDEATERDIVASLRELMHEVTIVAITHRRGAILPGDVVVELPASRE